MSTETLQVLPPTESADLSVQFPDAPVQPEALQLDQPTVVEQPVADNSMVMEGQFSTVEQKIYKNGAKHVYGVDAEGKKRHLSHDEILEAYGHAGEYQGARPKESEQTTADKQNNEGSSQEVKAADNSGQQLEALARQLRGLDRSDSRHKEVSDKLLDKMAEYADEKKLSVADQDSLYDAVLQEAGLAGAEQASDGKHAARPKTGRHRSSAEADSREDTGYVGKHRRSEFVDSETPIHDSVAEDMADLPDGIPLSMWTDGLRDVWDNLTDDERERARAAAAEQDNAEDLREPVIDTTQQGMRSRRQKILDKAKRAKDIIWHGSAAKLTTGRQTAREFYSDKELGKRRKIASAFVGALGLAGAVLLVRAGFEAHHLVEAAPQNHVDEALGAGAKVSQHSTELIGQINKGDMPWDVLHKAGIPDQEIMGKLTGAAKESGLPFHWHGSGEHRWLEVAGKSDTKAVLGMIGRFIKQ